MAAARTGSASAAGPRHQAGLGLIELLVALALGALLLGGVLQVFAGMRQTERSSEALARLQEAGRFALSFLARDIRMAGHAGCRSSAAGNALQGAPPSFQPGRGLQGWEARNTAPGQIRAASGQLAVVNSGDGGWLSSAGNVLEDNRVLPGTDIIRVWGPGGDPGEGRVIQISTGARTVINASFSGDIAEGDILLLSDCRQALWLQACELSSAGSPASLAIGLAGSCSPGNRSGLHLGLAEGASILPLAGTLYYIGKRGDQAGNPPALFRRRLNQQAGLGPAEELVEGVADLQLLYGEDLDGDQGHTADSYLPADQVSDWTRVVSVRLALLLQSVDDALLPQPQAYSFNGVVYDGTTGNGPLPGDRRLRRVFTSTVALRNRVP